MAVALVKRQVNWKDSRLKNAGKLYVNDVIYGTVIGSEFHFYKIIRPPRRKQVNAVGFVPLGALFPLVEPSPLPPPVFDNAEQWIVRGDEELSIYNFKSRTADPKWGFTEQTASVFRYDKKPVPNKNNWRVNVTRLNADYWRINGQSKQKINYLYRANSALFNKRDPDGVGFPDQQYLVMSGNILWGKQVGEYLWFQTLRPSSDVRQMTFESHPQFIHIFDIVTMRDGKTVHIDTPQGRVYYFLVTNEGFGYIPIELVKQRKEV